MRNARLAINTQTPLVRFLRPVAAPVTGAPLPLEELVRGEDYRFTAGGVTHMIHPYLAELVASGRTRDILWVSLNSEAAPGIRHDGIRFEFVRLGETERRGYGQAKEALWALLNTLPTAPAAPEVVPFTGWLSLESYHEACGKRIAAAHAESPLDVAYIHDFQQLGVARHLPPGVPRLFHLHTPFPGGLNAEWNRYFVRELNRYDTVIVSSNAYARALRRAGYGGELRRVYPFVDPRAYPAASPGSVTAFRERFRIPDDRRLLLNVARMDPMKGQDRMLRALPGLLREVPEAHLVFVGNGSFSSSRRGGLGLSKGAEWRGRLEALARDLGVADHVTFTGHLPQRDMPAAFAACEAFCLPSLREGFGLAVIEAWIYGKPVVVSRGAGVSELVREGDNGLLVDVDDPEALAAAFRDLLRDPGWAHDMGEEGQETSQLASLPAGMRDLDGILEEAITRRGRVRA